MSDMQAVHIRESGGPEVLELITVEKPLPGPDEILIKVAACGVNRPDCLQRSGLYPVPPDASPLPGLEVSGIIETCGESATRFKPGDRVCALVHGGGYAQYCVAKEGHALELPQSMDLIEAGAIAETLFTVYSNLWQRCELKPGETLLVHGGSSGIGSMAIQLARQLGCRVLTTAGSDEKCQFCRELGADRAINYRSESFADALADEKIDVVLDMVGGDYIQANINLLQRDGRYCFIAFLGGPKARVNFMPLLRDRLTLTGSTLRPQSTAEKTAIAQGIFEDVWPWFADKKITVPVFASFPLADAPRAHTLMESSQHMGKIVLLT